MQDDTFGKRVTPSLTTAMQRSSQPWPSSPGTSSPMALSQPLHDSCEISVVEYEQFLMDRVDTVLKRHFKDVKRKLKKVKSKVEKIDFPLDLMKKLIRDLEMDTKLAIAQQSSQVEPIRENMQLSWKRKGKSSKQRLSQYPDTQTSDPF